MRLGACRLGQLLRLAGVGVLVTGGLSAGGEGALAGALPTRLLGGLDLACGVLRHRGACAARVPGQLASKRKCGTLAHALPVAANETTRLRYLTCIDNICMWHIHSQPP